MSKHIKIRRGRDIKVSGAPGTNVRAGMPVDVVALQGSDFPGLHPDFHVEIGDEVLTGQVLFVDRKRPEIAFVSPVSGRVKEITRGRRRTLGLVSIEAEGEGNRVFEVPAQLDRDAVRKLLLTSGQWPALRVRPLDRIPDPEAVPEAIFVTAMNSEPLGENAATILRAQLMPFQAGIEAIAKLTDGPVFVCAASDMPRVEVSGQVQHVTFEGPHPSGLPGTHIHYLRPASRERRVWHIGYQDVIAIGSLLASGKIWSERIIAVGGPGVRQPGLVRTRLGVHLNTLLAEAQIADEARVFSGSILSGRRAHYLGRYHTQVAVLPRPSPQKARRFFGSRLVQARVENAGAIIPVAAYDSVMPLDILPVPLLRALSIGDAEAAEKLGCLELVEEDMALLAHVCPAGIDYGALLRRVLDDIEEQMT